MAVTPLRTAEGHDGVDPDPIRRALRGVSSVLGRVACALAPAAGSLGTDGSCRRGASGNLAGIAEIVDEGGVGVPAGICPAGGSVLVRVGDGRPVSIGKGNNLTSRSAQSTHGTRRPNIKLEDLPEDVLDRVFSKLQLNEVVRTSVLSSKWRLMWAISSKLRLDGPTICGRPRYFCNKPNYTKEFIDGVNTVLQQLHGKVVEELDVKIEFESILVDHLNNWISFAVSSLMKNLVLDLAPAKFVDEKDRYMFPIELFDGASISRIQHIKLSCVSFRPRSLFRGFPNLRKLDLHLFDASEMELDDMLSGCANLEWLSFIRCQVNDELKVKQPLSRLLYLRIAYCSIKKVELHAKNLKTFVYRGVQLPIDLGEVKKLETAELRLYGVTFEYVLSVLPSVLPGVQNFTLKTSYLPEMPLLLENIGRFSQLRFLRLLLRVNCSESNNILSLASFLRAAPLIEELEVHGEVPDKGAFRNLTYISVAGNNQLCSKTHQLHLATCSTSPLGKDKKKKSKSLVISLLTSIIVLSSVSVILLVWMLWKKHKLRHKSTVESPIAEQYERISYLTLSRGTNGFSEDNLLGSGRYGAVYKCILDNEEKTLAVKVFNLCQSGSSKSFEAECEAMRRIRHRRLIKIITCCSSTDPQGQEFKALVFEFMPNGSLDHWLHRESQLTSSRTLSFCQRLDIAVDIVTAVEYLHNNCQPQVIHCDLKPSNILLAEDMSARVGDFGISKFLPENTRIQNSYSSIRIRGSIGYVAPEYGEGSAISTSGDIYSLGILLLEMFTGRSPTDNMSRDSLDLYKFTEEALPDRALEIADPTIWLHKEPMDSTTGSRIRECLISIFRIGLSCSKQQPRGRASIRDVVVEMHAVRDAYLMFGN